MLGFLCIVFCPSITVQLVRKGRDPQNGFIVKSAEVRIWCQIAGGIALIRSCLGREPADRFMCQGIERESPLDLIHCTKCTKVRHVFLNTSCGIGGPYYSHNAACGKVINFKLFVFLEAGLPLHLMMIYIQLKATEHNSKRWTFQSRSFRSLKCF